MAQSKKVRHVKDLGSVYFDNAKNQWVGQIENGRYANGRTKFKRFYSSSQEECIFKMKGFKSNQLLSNNNPRGLLFKDFLNQYLLTIKKPKLKLASYERDVCTANNNIIPYLGGYDLSELTTNIIQQHLIGKLMTKNYSHSTINKAFVLTNECLKYACHQDLISKNPCEFVIKPSKTNTKCESKEIRFFTDEEIERFKKVALSKYSNGKLMYGNCYPLIILIYTGLRIGEMLALKWKDVDLDNRFIRVHANIAVIHEGEDRKVVIQNSTKTKKSRIVYLTDSAYEYLSEWKKLSPSSPESYVVVTDGKRDVFAVRNAYIGICSKANINNPQGLHTLRHTFASLMIRKGVDIKIISEMLGHASVSFTYNTYIHLIEEEKAKVVKQLNI